ncbi:MAG: hypothetical protein WCU88_08705 [Elusimicrobiota bacterium]|jgi:hypothetical protein
MKKAAAALFGTVLALAMLELFCRAGIIPNRHAGIAKLDRGKARSLRVLILGDSFIEDKSELSGRLTDYFRGKGAVVLNLASGGMRPIDYLRMMERYGQDYAPDLVLLSDTANNDVSDTLLRTSPEELERVLAHRPPRVRSYLAQAAADAWQAPAHYLRIKFLKRSVRRKRLPGAAQALNPYLILAARRHPDILSMNLSLDTPAARAACADNERIFARIQELTAKRRGKLLLTIFPSTLQVNPSHHPFFRGIGMRVDDSLLRSGVLQSRLMDFCRKQGLLCNDLLPEFRRRGASEFYLENDDHFNSAGQQLAFELITRRLEALRLAAREGSKIR